MFHLSSPPLEVVWTLVVERAPTVTRRCPRCEVARPFAHTGKFRVNGHGRRVDAWLIYGCTRCGFTWKLTLFTRVPPSVIGRERYQRFMDNDPAEALAVACDRALLARSGVQPDPAPVRVGGPDAGQLREQSGWIQARVRSVSDGASLRLDRLLTDRLEVSRSALQRHVKAGVVRVSPADKRAWRRPAHPVQRYLLDADRLWPRLTPPAVTTGSRPA